MQFLPFPTKDNMYQYKVLTQKDRFFSGKFDPAVLEQGLNSYASEGWRAIAVTTASFPGMLGQARDEMIIVMEREK